MTSEADEFFYHECMTHPAALAHPNPESVLVIGGGDGGSSEELLKHPSVKRIVMAELDPVVIDISKKWLGAIHQGAFDDPRLEVKIGDGFEFVKSTSERFDMIVLDLTDPDTPAFHLYSEQFFRMCQRILRPGGMLTLHLGSPVYQAETVRKNAANLRKVFRHVAPMSLFVPLYGSLWCLAVASDTVDPRAVSADTIEQRIKERASRRVALLPSRVACGAVCAAVVCTGASSAESCGCRDAVESRSCKLPSRYRQLRRTCERRVFLSTRRSHPTHKSNCRHVSRIMRCACCGCATVMRSRCSTAKAANLLRT